MKTLVIFYSRTGTAKKVAEALAEKLACETEEIFDTQDRSGPMGWLYAGRDATLRKLTKIKPPEKNPADYELAVIGTPIWSFNVSTPIRAYLNEFKNKLPRVAFYCTMDGSGAERAFREMGQIIGKEPSATQAFLTKEVANNTDSHQEKINQFAKKLHGQGVE